VRLSSASLIRIKRNRAVLSAPDAREDFTSTLSRAHARGHRDRDAPAHGHDRANGPCRGPRGPNVLRAIPSLRDSGRSADATSRPLQREDAPNVPAPTCNGGPPVSNILRSI